MAPLSPTQKRASTLTGEGCNPSYSEESEDTDTTLPTNQVAVTLDPRTAGYTTESYNNQTVVKIWRTPQFQDWYKENPRDGEPQMDLSGQISNVAHFESDCTTYDGVENDDGTINWSTTNDTCLLVPDGTDGIRISDSSNGRGAGDELVLRFSATITFSPDVYSFKNKHVIAVAPTGRYNVTDSYVQIQNMFAERAADCADGDTACANTSTGGN